jgi:myo-inositol-1(or 4)-monophosphatase
MKSTQQFLQLRNTAIRAAEAAGQVLLKHFRKTLRIETKSDAGLVTNADLASERAAIRVLKREFPEFGILTEESAGQVARSEGRWILDPLDGTTNYAHGVAHFCVTIAAEWEGQIVAGVTYHPVLGDLYTAVRGKGAFANGKRMHVSRVPKLSEALLTTGFCSRKDLWLEQELQTFERLSRAASGVRRPGSAALDMVSVARGIYDGFWERGLRPWDIAAGSLMIEEAGGKVTDFIGKSLRLDSGQVLCSNGLIHTALVREGAFAAPARTPMLETQVTAN